MKNLKINYARNFLFLNFFYNYLIKKKRLEIYTLFSKELAFDSSTTLLDVGTTSSLENHENILIKLYPFKSKISCLSNLNLQDIKKKLCLHETYLGDGCNMSNIADSSFDLVISTATIEHVGSYERQFKFIQECLRVTKKYVFITTPNRFFPFDFHTRLPLLHFLPKQIHRKLLKFLGDDFFSLEKNLNLMSYKEISNILNNLKLKNYKIRKVNLFGICSNLIIILEKI